MRNLRLQSFNSFSNYRFPFLAKIQNTHGMSLVEILTVTAIMSILMLGMMAMQNYQLKSNSYLDFQLKRTQLQNSLIGQVLNDPSNCACLFAGATPFAATPVAPGATLTGVTPTQIGRYNFATPGVCATATMPQPLADNIGIDGLQATAIGLTNIMNISGGSYTGELQINLQSIKPVSGPQNLLIKIPVAITTIPAGAGTVNFVNCSAVVTPPKSMQCVAGTGGYDGDLSRPTLACVNSEKHRTCMCSADWSPSCDCTTVAFSQPGNYPSAALAGALTSSLSRPVFVASNGIDMTTCMCSADWTPKCECSTDVAKFANEPVSCASNAGGGNGLSRPVVACASSSLARMCECSADWSPAHCNCTDVPFSAPATSPPSCAAAQGVTKNLPGELSRGSITCGNGASMISCMCSADWSPNCSCQSVNM